MSELPFGTARGVPHGGAAGANKQAWSAALTVLVLGLAMTIGACVATMTRSSWRVLALGLLLSLLASAMVGGSIARMRRLFLRRVEETLRVASERLALAVQAAEIGVWEWDVVAQKIWWDDQMRAFYDYKNVEQADLYEAWLARLHADDRDRVERELESALRGDSKFDTEFRIRLDTGTIRYLKASGRVHAGADGAAVRMVGVNLDITNRKAAEQCLIESEAKFRSLFELSPVGIALNDLQTGRFLHTNEALAAPTGFSADELTRMTYWDITPERYRDQEAQQLQDLEERDRYGPYEKEYQRRDGTTYPVLLSGIRLKDAAGRAVIWSIVQDISERKAIELQLAEAARTDKLTGLVNRAQFMERLEQAAARVRAGRQRLFAVFFLDFDRFKMVNDTLGHESGDALLRLIAQRLKAELRASDAFGFEDPENVVSRFGGDEFLILVNDLSMAADAPAIAERLLNALAPTYHIDGSEVHSTASIGIVTSDQCTSSAEDIVRNADLAMYEAKRAGRACSVVFNEAMHVRLTRHVAIENSLRRAIGTAQLYLVYQPIVDLQTGRVVSAEALIRWNHPLLGAIAPSEFIPIAEESNLIVALGQWVQREACATMVAWRAQDPQHVPNTMSVNISRAELSLGQRLIDQVHDLLAELKLPAQCLQLEVTEREVMRHPEAAHAALHALRQLGIQLAMDDFGTGTSSLGFLRNYPFNTVKIDRSFIQDVTSSADVLAVIHATINLVENLGMISLAEGVEDAAQLALLQSLGCRNAQGYFLSHPVAGERFLATVRQLRQSAAARARVEVK